MTNEKLNKVFEEYEALKNEEKEKKAELKLVTDRIKDVNEFILKLSTKLNKDVIQVGDLVVTVNRITSSRFDSTRFREEHQDMYEEFKKDSISNRFKIERV